MGHNLKSPHRSALPSPAPVRRASLTTLILDQLRDYVVAHNLVVGDRLPAERELAARLGVSRPTLRVALNQLAERGALRRVQGGGTYLEEGYLTALVQTQVAATNANLPPLPQIVETRVCLEPILARLAARRASNEDLAALDEEVQRAGQSLDDAESWRQHDLRFHARIAQLSGNPILADALDSVVSHLPNLWARLHDKISIRDAHNDHLEIIAALRRRDAVGAARQMKNHLQIFERAAAVRGRRRSSKPAVAGA